MSLFVHITDNCEASASRHGVLNELEKFRDRVERTQSTSSFDKFPAPYLVKKKLAGRQYRLIAKSFEVGDDVVVVFLEVMIRGDHDYDADGGFGNDPEGYGQRYFANLVTDDQIRAYIASRTETPPADLPVPSPEEYQLLYSAFAPRAHRHSDVMVYETDPWIAAVRDDRMRPFLSQLASAALCAYEDTNGLKATAVPGRPNWKVHSYKDENGLLLLAITSTEDEAEDPDPVRRVRALQASNEPIDIGRFARRAYPGIILADVDMWVAVEQEDQANMALSPEESDVLLSAHAVSSAVPVPFPLFINGRAGSGKSTILQYLFAEFAGAYLQLAPDARKQIRPPIYLTANAELVRIAKDRIERLLQHDTSVGGAVPTTGGTVALNDISDSFRDFQSYELSLLEPLQRRDRFPLSKRITYSGFRNRWRLKFGQQPDAYKKFGPELSWHVIRTYIKGTSPDDILTPTEYGQLAYAQQSVSTETFKLIFDRVYDAWYRPLLDEERLWDDQDLARYVLENDLANPIHPAVFCDEAQDFTRVELELLLRINLFSSRRLNAEELGRVCFVFAGDQFQTLNPTGFRWEAIKAAFVEKFVEEMDYGRKRRPDLNYRELQFNYRSTDKIVRFSNSVQAYRAASFRIPELRPQHPWGGQPASLDIEYFDSADGEFWAAYRDMKGVVLIVPCAEGDERAYVDSDKLLQPHIPIVDGIPINIFSASRAKGCEYPTTIVYGFGKYFVEHLKDAISGLDPERDKERMLPFEYFINRLYVAVSRPKARLVLVDDIGAIEDFWTFAISNQGFQALWDTWPRGRDIWSDMVETMRRGVHRNLRQGPAIDLAEFARNHRAEGKARRDGYYLRQAAQTYQGMGDFVSQAECNALALEFEEQFEEAGRQYEAAGFFRDAIRMFWRNGRASWPEIDRLALTRSQIAAMAEVVVVRAVATPKDGARLAEALRSLRVGLSDPQEASRLLEESSAWTTAADAVVDAWLSYRGDSEKLLPANQLYGLVNDIRALGIATSQGELARICEAAGRLDEARELLSRANLMFDERYKDLVLRLSVYPENLSRLSAEKAVDAILTAYRGNPATKLNEEQAGIVFDALVERKDFSAAIALGWEHALSRRLGDLLKVDGLEDGLRQAVRHGLVRGMLRSGDWECLGHLLSPRHGNPAVFRARLPHCTRHDFSQMQLLLVREWAREGVISTVPERLRSPLQKWLRGYGESWTNKGRSDDFSFDEVAAAIERGGRYNDAKEFYLGIRTPPCPDSTKAAAVVRLIACKNRYLEELRPKGETGTTRQLHREIQQALASAKIRAVGNIPNYPPVEAIVFDSFLAKAEQRGEVEEKAGLDDAADKPSPLPDRIVFQIGSLEFIFSRTNQRLNITSKSSLQTAYFLVEKRIAGGEMAFSEIEDAFECREWGLHLRVLSADIGKKLEVRADESGVVLTLEV